MALLPTSPGPASLVLESDQPVFVSYGDSGKRQSRIAGGHKWSLKYTYGSMPQSGFAPIDAFIMLQDGELGSFTVKYPIVNRGTWVTSSVTVSGSHAAGINSIQLNLTTGQTAKAGDVIYFAAHTKVYKIISDATASSSIVTVTIKPALILDIANLEACNTSNILFNMSVKGSHKFKTSSPMIFTYQLDMVESIS